LLELHIPLSSEENIVQSKRHSPSSISEILGALIDCHTLLISLTLYCLTNTPPAKLCVIS